jgi:hypothetical protein
MAIRRTTPTAAKMLPSGPSNSTYGRPGFISCRHYDQVQSDVGSRSPLAGIAHGDRNGNLWHSGHPKGRPGGNDDARLRH